MTQNGENGGVARLVVGIGGSTRAGSTTEVVLRAILEQVERRGASTRLITGGSLVLPPYEPAPDPVPEALPLIDSMREADALVLGSPGYHGSISGLVKNAIDYSEELRGDSRVYFDGLPVACVATGFGWSGAVHTLGALRDIVHALRGWPTPLGIVVNTAERGSIVEDRIESESLKEQIAVVAGQLMASPRSPSTTLEGSAR